MIQDSFIWVGKNKGNDNDKLLLAGRHDKGGYHIAMMIDFCEGKRQKPWFERFREAWKPKEAI